MKRIKKVEESSALIGKVFDSFETDSHQDAPSIYAVRNAISNPNLLINSNFRNPVNQRGQKNYISDTALLYTIDRWRIGMNVTLDVGNGYITITNNDTVKRGFGQNLEFNLENNCTYTVSVKVKSITGRCILQEQSGQLGSELVAGLNTYTFNTKDYTDLGLLIERITINLEANASIELEYIKLEQGSIATTFVPRHYTEELVLCKRYFQIVHLTENDAYSSGRYFKGPLFPVEMRKVPTYKANFAQIATDITSDFERMTVYSNRIGAVVFKNGHVVMSGVVELDAEIR